MSQSSKRMISTPENFDRTNTLRRSFRSKIKIEKTVSLESQNSVPSSILTNEPDSLTDNYESSENENIPKIRRKYSTSTLSTSTTNFDNDKANATLDLIDSLTSALDKKQENFDKILAERKNRCDNLLQEMKIAENRSSKLSDQLISLRKSSGEAEIRAQKAIQETQKLAEKMRLLDLKLQDSIIYAGNLDLQLEESKKFGRFKNYLIAAGLIGYYFLFVKKILLK